MSIVILLCVKRLTQSSPAATSAVASICVHTRVEAWSRVDWLVYAGKTTLLRALVAGEIKGLPKHAQVLHVEQEVVGDDTAVIEVRQLMTCAPASQACRAAVHSPFSVHCKCCVQFSRGALRPHRHLVRVQAVLECDVERSQLLAEEAELLAQGKPADGASASAGADAGRTFNGADRSASATSTSAAAADADPASSRLQQVYARLQEIDADGAPARAASILAGLSFDEAMQKRATKTFSGGAYCEPAGYLVSHRRSL